jgi:ATP-binding cassette subfamily F protein 3
MLTLSDQVRQAVPAIDGVISEYAAGYVQHIEDSTSDPGVSQSLNLESEVDFITTLLKDAGGDKSAVSSLAEVLLRELKDIYAANASKVYGDSASRKLDRDTLLTAQNRSSMNVFGADGTELDLLSGRKVESRVDKKKLEKAEKKIAAKLAKRETRTVEYEPSKLLVANDNEDYDTFFLTVNPLDLGTSQGKSKDVKIDNFDLYVGAGKRILSNTSLTLAYGRRYGIVGQNGVGKSTLLRALSRRELPVPKHITILYVEQEVVGDERSALQTVLDADVWRKHLLKEQDRIQKRISEIGQQCEELDSKDAIVRQLEEERDDLETNLNDIYDKLTEMESDKAESRAGSILFGLGFSLEAQAQETKSFSGGWRMRLALARALFCKPDLLMLDEPSNMLDVPSITFLSDYLQSYPSTVLVVSHDRAFLNDIATDIIYQHSERLDYYRGSNFDSFYATREERRKNAQREYDNQMAYRKHLQTFIDKFRYNAAKSSEAQSRIKKLEKLPVLEAPEEERTVTFKFPDPDKLSPPIIQLQDVTFGYSPDRLLLNQVDLSVGMESRIALVGGNGCGKTTLLKLLIEQIRPLSGFVQRNGRLRIGYFAQHHIDGMDNSLSPVEWMAKIYPGKSDEEYRRHLGAFGITSSLGLQKIALLSGGQKSRVAFACLGLSNPHVLVLDEPSNHLDTAGLDALADALKQFKGGILMVSHDVATIDRVCNEIWLSENGTVRKFPGTINDYKTYILQHSTGAGVVTKH